MARTKVLIDYDLITHEIRRAIHPEDDSQIVHHHEQPGWGRIHVSHELLPLDPATCKPMYNLEHIADEIERQTGKRPPNGRQHG